MALHELYKYINKYYDQVGRSRALTGGLWRWTSKGIAWDLLSVPLPQHRLGEGLGPGLGECSSGMLPDIGYALTCPHPHIRLLSRSLGMVLVVCSCGPTGACGWCVGRAERNQSCHLCPYLALAQIPSSMLCMATPMGVGPAGLRGLPEGKVQARPQGWVRA